MHRPRTRQYAAALVLCATGLASSGCGTGPLPSPPSGIDGLVIPTPSPDPQDFTTDFTNRWLPLHSGATWTYEVPGTGQRRTVTVTDRTERIDGVETVVVTDDVVGPRGRAMSHEQRFYAQDRAGNVWLFGHDGGSDSHGDWRAGTGGAQAGLAMPRRPRVGDGWRIESAPGAAMDIATVVDLDQARDVPQGSYGDLLELETTSDLVRTLRVRSWYAEGVGPVYDETIPGEVEELTEFDPGVTP